MAAEVEAAAAGGGDEFAGAGVVEFGLFAGAGNPLAGDVIL
jgi:hypothetical protein